MRGKKAILIDWDGSRGPAGLLEWLIKDGKKLEARAIKNGGIGCIADLLEREGLVTSSLAARASGQTMKDTLVVTNRPASKVTSGDVFKVGKSSEWRKLSSALGLDSRRIARIRRVTRETDITLSLNLDGGGKCRIATGLSFLDHMLEQIAKHSGCDLDLRAKGDLEVDEHHTVEDVAIALGQAFAKALGDKRGIGRYGFSLPMDEASASALIDLSGRNAFVWRASFKREMIGDCPTELFKHFFKSFSDESRCALHIRASGENEHHKIEAIFKAVARCLRQAVRKDSSDSSLPSSKGVL